MFWPLYNHWQNVWDEPYFSYEIAYCGQNSISIFHESFSISKIFILRGRLGTRLYFADISWFPIILRLQSFGDLWGIFYVPCLLLIIRFTCGERKLWWYIKKSQIVMTSTPKYSATKYLKTSQKLYLYDYSVRNDSPLKCLKNWHFQRCFLVTLAKNMDSIFTKFTVFSHFSYKIEIKQIILCKINTGHSTWYFDLSTFV